MVNDSAINYQNITLDSLDKPIGCFRSFEAPNIHGSYSGNKKM